MGPCIDNERYKDEFELVRQLSTMEVPQIGKLINGGTWDASVTRSLGIRSFTFPSKSAKNIMGRRSGFIHLGQQLQSCETTQMAQDRGPLSRKLHVHVSNDNPMGLDENSS